MFNIFLKVLYIYCLYFIHHYYIKHLYQGGGIYNLFSLLWMPKPDTKFSRVYFFKKFKWEKNLAVRIFASLNYLHKEVKSLMFDHGIIVILLRSYSNQVRNIVCSNHFLLWLTRFEGWIIGMTKSLQINFPYIWVQRIYYVCVIRCSFLSIFLYSVERAFTICQSLL